MCMANQRCSRCRRKTSARHGETGPTPPLLPNSTRKARLFRVQILKDASAVVEANGGKVLGSTFYPFPTTTDFSSMLLRAKASGAKVLALGNAGADPAWCTDRVRGRSCP